MPLIAKMTCYGFVFARLANKGYKLSMVAEYPRNLPTNEVRREKEMIKKYVDEFGQKTIYLCLFGKRFVWKDGKYHGWYKA